MNFDLPESTRVLSKKLLAFMEAHVYPNEAAYAESLAEAEDPWQTPPLMEDLKQRAREEGLWNLFMPGTKFGAGLSNLEYAPLAEIMGRVPWAPEIFNCSAPDTGNMGVLADYGTPEQQERWLQPLLEGRIRSGFAMTEPAVASSDATNVETAMIRDGDDYVINGRKWFTSGAMNRHCRILIVMGKTDPDNPNRHLQQSMILVPMDTPGVRVLRPLSSFGYLDPPEGHAEIDFDNVRVPADNLLLGEGRGFEIAQGRLGPGRIHHCMRLIGCAQRALELTCHRAENRSTFGRKLSQHQSVREHLARMFCAIEQARLLTFKAADRMDRQGNKAARDLIAAIKIVAPSMACDVIDRAIQIHGGAGVTGDFPLAFAYNYARTIRLADGPDEVHMMQLGRDLARRLSSASASGRV
ncbi:acyl-CoA dehydrogenase family protein [Elongatibacter sediminis]|uniref:Acyl-CoA dehydrogenase family protein n=1 Tax=Elongatibacter sediminis TaxID=3119006 RepID=A0AAW9RM21_9GAMM